MGPKIRETGTALHNNTRHSQRYIHTWFPNLLLYVAADQSVTGDADVTLSSASIIPGAGAENWVMPFAGYQLRLGTAAANDIVDVWWDVDGIQRSRKYPHTVRDATKETHFLAIAANISDLIFWQTVKGASITVNLKARRQTAGVATVLFSDVYATLMTARRDQP